MFALEFGIDVIEVEQNRTLVQLLDEELRTFVWRRFW